MNINEVFEALFKGASSDIGTIETILAILIATLVMSVYEFLIYRLVSKKTYYNKSMHISLLVIPFFISSIVAALQSNMVITLGTIGALAIIRYRSAIKDPIDMLYLLWSVFIGIACGCQLYKLCILTSIMVTFVLVMVELFGGKLLSNPYILVLNCNDNIENGLNEIIKKYAKSYRLKSRNFTSNSVDYVYEVSTKKAQDLTKELHSLPSVKQFSLLEFDTDDAI